MRVHHIVTGHEIDPAAVQEAVNLSTTKYCSVQAMLRHTASFVTTFEIVPDKTLAAAA